MDNVKTGVQTKGFTLVELITVVVILAIVAAMGTAFIVSSTEAYNRTQQRFKLVNRSRQALERISRQVRDALPNSVRVSGAGDSCLEFLPVAAATTYLDPVPDQANGADESNSIDTAPFAIDFGTVRFASVAPMSTGEIYGSGPESLARVNSTSATNITLSNSKRWERNSIRQRVYLADAPTAFCLEGGSNLRVYERYDTSIPLANVTADTSGILMAQSAGIVGGSLFSISGGTEDRNAVVTINISFSEGGEAVEFAHQVMVRNVP